MSNARLHKLVLGLNKGEKRYFKLFMKRYSHNNDLSIYGKLFDYLVKTKIYNKEVLLKRNEYINPTQLNNIQKRLFDYVLLSLRTYNSNSTKNHRIYFHQTLINFEILLSKGLYAEGLKMLLRAEKIAEENEFYDSLKEVLDQKKHLLTTRVKSKNIKKDILDVQEKQEAIKKIIFYTERFKELYYILYEIFKSEGRVLRDKKLIEDVKIELEKHKSVLSDFEKSYQSSYLYYYNLRFVFQFIADWEKADKCISMPLAKFHNSNSYNINHFTQFRRLYTAKIISLINRNRFKRARSFINEIKEIPNLNPNNKEIDLIVFEDVFFFELESYLHEFKFDKAVESIKLNMKKITSLESKMHSVNIQSKRYRIALSYFGASQFGEALNWINKILISDKLKFRKDILVSVQLLNLLIHFELKNYRYIKNKIKSVTSYFKKIDRLLIPEKLVLSTLSKVDQKSKNHFILFDTLRRDLEKHFKTQRLDTYFFCYFDLVKWIALNFPTVDRVSDKK